MAEDEGGLPEGMGTKVGIIPDFFHDIIAHIVPGYTALLLLACDCYVAGGELRASDEWIAQKDFSGLAKVSIVMGSLIVAYVIVRFFEEVGVLLIHNRLLCWKPECLASPKWSLIFGVKNDRYTQSFKDLLRGKIEKWLAPSNEVRLSVVSDCKERKKDDYFNVIRVYLRERFPSVALYEKKQNALVAMSRSLVVVFIGNVVAYHLFLLGADRANLHVSLLATTWLFGNFVFGMVFWCRYRRDQRYYAEYIFEAFVGTKKMLKSKKKPSSGKDGDAERGG
ncbi:MAG: hypothetical protein ACLP9L_29615 [Thermoguttaceae bacterium]